MARIILTFTLFFLILAPFCASADPGVLTVLEKGLEFKLSECVNNFTKWLEEFNDKHLGNSELGTLLHYKEIKPNLEEISDQGRGMKKMSMGMLPLIFHVGATSTWMLLTTILAAKSVAIGIALLVFKIAVSSAKVASFFTALKSKHHDHHHGWSWAPHYEHHGHERSLSGVEPHHVESHHYSPEWTPDHSHGYHTIPTYKEYSEHDVSHPEVPYADTRKRDTRYS